MSTFIWGMVLFLGLDILGKVVALWTGSTYRAPGETAIDTLANVAFLCWGVWVLAGRGA